MGEISRKEAKALGAAAIVVAVGLVGIFASLGLRIIA